MGAQPMHLYFVRNTFMEKATLTFTFTFKAAFIGHSHGRQRLAVLQMLLFSKRFRRTDLYETLTPYVYQSRIEH